MIGKGSQAGAPPAAPAVAAPDATMPITPEQEAMAKLLASAAQDVATMQGAKFNKDEAISMQEREKAIKALHDRQKALEEAQEWEVKIG